MRGITIAKCAMLRGYGFFLAMPYLVTPPHPHRPLRQLRCPVAYVILIYSNDLVFGEFSSVFTHNPHGS